MELQTVAFYGRSGSGKGTQAVLLKKFLEERDEEHQTLYFETGKSLREFAEKSKTIAGTYTQNVLNTGSLMPSFLVVCLWANFFVENLEGNEHILLDGFARREQEAHLVEGALRFFDRKNPTIIVLDVSREWAFDRLKERAREDDTDDNIRRRLEWYEENVVPAMNYFKKSDTFTFLTINGELPIADVHQEILRELKLT